MVSFFYVIIPCPSRRWQKRQMEILRINFKLEARERYNFVDCADNGLPRLGLQVITWTQPCSISTSKFKKRLGRLGSRKMPAKVLPSLVRIKSFTVTRTLLGLLLLPRKPDSYNARLRQHQDHDVFKFPLAVPAVNSIYCNITLHWHRIQVSNLSSISTGPQISFTSQPFSIS